MIFVTLGTQDKQFVRLIEAVNKIDTDEQIVAQVGSTNCSKLKLRDNIKIYDYLSDNEFDKYMNNARIIITHAGVGTIIKGLKLNKTMIVAARLKKYKEHVNDHQLQILDNFSKEGYIYSLDDSFVFQGKRTTGGEMRKVDIPQYTLVGNAVPPLMAKAIGDVILKKIR